MISITGEIKIVDFGLSKSNALELSKISQHGDIIGTPVYMSMESLENSESATEKSDVYALGVVFYELLTQQLPFIGKTSNELYKNILLGHYVEANKIDPTIPIEINNLINNMLKKEHYLRVSLDTIISTLKKYIDFDKEDLSLSDSFFGKNNITGNDIGSIPTHINRQTSGGSVSEKLYSDYISRERFLTRTLSVILALGSVLGAIYWYLN
jgi:serine/threonine protein kinase